MFIIFLFQVFFLSFDFELKVTWTCSIKTVLVVSPLRMRENCLEKGFWSVHAVYTATLQRKNKFSPDILRCSVHTMQTLFLFFCFVWVHVLCCAIASQNGKNSTVFVHLSSLSKSLFHELGLGGVISDPTLHKPELLRNQNKCRVS